MSRRGFHTFLAEGVNLGRVAGRDVSHFEMSPGNVVDIGYNNPIGLVEHALYAVYTGRPLFNSFLEAGGVRAFVRVLKEPTCPMTLFCIAQFIHRLLTSELGLSAGVGSRFLRSGE